MNNYQLSINDYPLYNGEWRMENGEWKEKSKELSIINYQLKIIHCIKIARSSGSAKFLSIGKLGDKGFI